MINRGLTKDSQYHFNKKTKKLEKDDKKAQTIESLSKQANKQVFNVEDIGKTVNKESEPARPINSLTVITAEDNLIHNYFYDLEYSWDASNCLTVATIKMPRLDTENINYWTTYNGQVTIYGGYNFTFDKVNNNNFTTEQDAANSLVKYGEGSDIKPLFRGNVARIKEYQTHATVYVDSIGVRFKQKIPDEFRQSYINGQNVADAFQAICEFLGVQFICPPRTAVESEEDVDLVNTEVGDGTENDVTKQQQTAQQIADTAKNKVENSNQNSTDATGTATPSTTDTTATNGTDTTTPTDETDLTNNEEINPVINGYDDISFDANGAIVHGSTVIETSPDMAETLAQMSENPLDKYLEDETGIIEKVKSFLDGDMFEELHNNVMDYGAITIEPKSTTSTDISTSTVGNTNTSDLSNTDGSTNGSTESTKMSGSVGGSVATNTPNPSSRSARGHRKPIALSKNYINTLTPEQARQLRTSNYQSGVYTSDTMQKLLWRSMGITLH